MASKGDYILSKGFNQNIFHWNDKDTYVNTINKQGKGFFPGNETLNPGQPGGGGGANPVVGEAIVGIAII